MSHFTVGVILDIRIPANYHDQIENLMEPFSEHIDVPEYNKTCWCIENNAYKRRNKGVEKVYGKWEMFRLKYDEIPESERPVWSEYVAPYLELEKELYEQALDEVAPDEDCEDCGGSGIRQTAYNPNSKWDWYVVGGRWDGYLTQNRQYSENGFNFGEKHHQIDNNTVSVSDYLARQNTEDFGLFAYVTPTGEWVERGEMGWWAVVSNEKDGSDWHQEQINLLERYNDGNYIIVGLDCHI